MAVGPAPVLTGWEQSPSVADVLVGARIEPETSTAAATPIRTRAKVIRNLSDMIHPCCATPSDARVRVSHKIRTTVGLRQTSSRVALWEGERIDFPDGTVVEADHVAAVCRPISRRRQAAELSRRQQDSTAEP